MEADDVWRVFKDHLELLPTEDYAFSSDALEEAFVGIDRARRQLVLVDSLPLELVADVGRVDHVEPLDVLHFGPEGPELYYVILGLEVGLLFFHFSRRDLEVADRSIGLSVEADLQLLLRWV